MSCDANCKLPATAKLGLATVGGHTESSGFSTNVHAVAWQQAWVHIIRTYIAPPGDHFNDGITCISGSVPAVYAAVAGCN